MNSACFRRLSSMGRMARPAKAQQSRSRAVTPAATRAAKEPRSSRSCWSEEDISLSRTRLCQPYEDGIWVTKAGYRSPRSPRTSKTGVEVVSMRERGGLSGSTPRARAPATARSNSRGRAVLGVQAPEKLRGAPWSRREMMSPSPDSNWASQVVLTTRSNRSLAMMALALERNPASEPARSWPSARDRAAKAMASSTAPVQAAERSVSCRRSRVSMARPPVDSPRSEQWQGGRRSPLHGACGGESGYSCLDCRPPPERPVPRPGRVEAHGLGSARRCGGRVPEAVSPGGRGNRPPRA